MFDVTYFALSVCSTVFNITLVVKLMQSSFRVSLVEYTYMLYTETDGTVNSVLIPNQVYKLYNK